MPHISDFEPDLVPVLAKKTPKNYRHILYSFTLKFVEEEFSQSLLYFFLPPG